MNTRFIKKIDDKIISKIRKNIVINKTTEDGNFQIFNPSNELLFEDGWEIYTKPKPTAEEELTIVKNKKIDSIYSYDKSNNVNTFFLNGMAIWLDKTTRAGLKLRFESEIAMGKEETTLWYGNTQFNLPLEEAVKMLYAIEVYASTCYDNTQSHLAKVENLQTIEEIESYDITANYPEKLHF